jgi:hypothetical protein
MNLPIGPSGSVVAYFFNCIALEPEYFFPVWYAVIQAFNSYSDVFDV